MDPTNIVFGLVLIAIAAVLTNAHWRARRMPPDPRAGEREIDYKHRRLRRRMQASAMIGIAGVAIIIGQWIPDGSLTYIIYWGTVVILVLWITLLALADMWATRNYYGQIRHDQLVERARLEYEVDRRRHEGNGERRENGRHQPGAPGRKS